METTTGALLDGRVAYVQPQQGYRTGIEPVFLAASVPARRGERVIEAGTGAGAGLLCLLARAPGVTGLGVERDGAVAAIAMQNAAANGFDGMRVATADLLHVCVPGWEEGVDHAMANPPWHDADSTASGDGQRDAAKRGRPGLLAAWARALGRRLRHRGTMTLIVPARAAAEALAALQAGGCGSMALLPLWPAAGREARIVLVQGMKGARAGARVLPGVVLHDEQHRYTPAAEDVLRRGAALAFG